MYKGRGSTNEKMMRGIPGRGEKAGERKGARKSWKRGPINLHVLTEEIKQRREKGRDREWQFEEEAVKPAELEESAEVNKEAAICFNDFIFTFSDGGDAESQEKESYVNFRNPQKLWTIRAASVMKDITPCLCILLRTGGVRREKEEV